MANEELERTIYEIKRLESQFGALQADIQRTDSALAQAEITMTALDQSSKIKKETESLVPLGNGIFVRATLSKPEKVMFDAGAGVVVEKTVAEAIETIKEKKKEIELLRTKIERDASSIAERIQFLNAKAQKLSQES